MFKRVGLFLLTNILIIALVSIIINLLGIQPYLDENGINYMALLIFASIWGMGGAFISLMLSKTIAKWSMKLQYIDPRRATGDAAVVVDMVHRLAQKARLPKMPDVAVYDSPEVNAFATGPSKSNSLVAVSTGLLRNMSRDEVEGVIGHEVSHIANGDMVTMTLLQGVINAFTIFLARVVAFMITSFLRGDDDEGPGFMVQWVLIIVLDIFFSMLGMIVVAAFSRYREFHADRGGARLAGKDSMVNALQRLKTAVDQVDTGDKALATFKISNKSSFMALFSTHPPLEERIKRLQQAQIRE